MDRPKKRNKSKRSPKSVLSISCFLYIGLFISGFSFAIFYYFQQDLYSSTASSPTISSSHSSFTLNFNIIELIVEYITRILSFDFFNQLTLFKSKLATNSNNEIKGEHLQYNDSKFQINVLIQSSHSISSSSILPVLDECFDCGLQELSFLTIDRVRNALSKHPFRHIAFQRYLNISAKKGVFTLVNYIKYLYEHPACRRHGIQLPVFVSMANVFSDLYWQL